MPTPYQQARLVKSLRARGLSRWLPAIQERPDHTLLWADIRGKKVGLVLIVTHTATPVVKTYNRLLPPQWHTVHCQQCRRPVITQRGVDIHPACIDPTCDRVKRHEDYVDTVLLAIRHASARHRGQPPDMRQQTAQRKAASP